MILDPEAITQIDRLADLLADREWLVGEVGKPTDSETATNLMKPFIIKRQAAQSAGFFEEMVRAPLTTGPWHVPPEEHISWGNLPVPWQRTRADARRQTVWTHYLAPDEPDGSGSYSS